MTARVYEAGKRLALGAPATSVHWIEGNCYFGLGDGAVHMFDDHHHHIVTQAHSGAILCCAPHPAGAGFLTGGDDGCIALTGSSGDLEVVANLGKKWIDHVVASSTSGVIVAGVGKQAIVLKDGQESHRFTYPSTVGGLALDAKGRRLAVSHYGGVTLRLALVADDKGQTLAWAGSHLALTLSPDADYVMSAMQENALHGWRIADKLDLRMTGYAAKTRSFSWNKNGRWLATSGADCAVVWPFVGKLGPQGKEPLQLARREALVTAVAFHPSEDILAIGYADGAAFTIRLADQVIIELDEPGEAAVSALAWSGDGLSLALGDEAGRGALVSLAP